MVPILVFVQFRRLLPRPGRFLVIFSSDTVASYSTKREKLGTENY